MQNRRGRPSGYKLSEESKARISKSKTGQIHSTKTKEKIRNTLLNYFKRRGNVARKLNLDELRTLNVSLKEDDIKIVETLDIFNFLDGGWKRKDLRDLGHQMLEIRMTNKTIEKAVGNASFIDITGKGDMLRIKGADSKHMSCPSILIKSDAHFDGMYDRISAGAPVLLSLKKSPYLFVKSMRTNRIYKGKSYICQWKRIRLPVTAEQENSIARNQSGGDAVTDKLALVAINGSLPCEFSQTMKRDILALCGPIAMGRLCNVTKVKITVAACGGYM